MRVRFCGLRPFGYFDESDSDDELKINEDIDNPQKKQQCLFKNFKTSSTPCFLPDDVLFIIFRYCPQEQLITNSQVCKQWRHISEHIPNCWKAITSADNPSFITLLRWALPRYGSTVEQINMSAVISGSTPVKSKVFSFIGKHCKKLRYLNLRGAQISPSILNTISENNPTLEWLNISGCIKFTPACFQNLIENCPQLTHLIVHHSYLSGSHASVLTQGKNLKMLCLNNSPDSFNHSGIQTCLYSLEFLDLSSTRINDEALWNIIQFSYKLKALILNNCENITGSVFQSKIPNLVALDLSHCNNLSTDSLYWISQLPKLERLDISWCKKLSSTAIFEFVEDLLPRDLLQQFWFAGTQLDAEALELLKRFSYPIIIKPDSCRQIPRNIRLQFTHEIPERPHFLFPPPKFEKRSSNTHIDDQTEIFLM